MTDIEIEYWNDPDADDDDNNNINDKNVEFEIQQEIAAEIKQQQMEQEAIQKKRDLQCVPTRNKNKNKDKDKNKNSKPPPISGRNKLESAQTYSYNDIVVLNDGRCGKIKFIGTLGFESDTWYGLILQTATGSHNGTVKGRKYWICKPNHGTFVKKNQIKNIKLQRIGGRFSIHEKVKTPKGKGWIRYIGSNQDKEEEEEEEEEEEYTENQDNDDNNNIMYGIELIEHMGKNSGSINNLYYFTCAHYRGIFYMEEELIWIPPDAPPTPRISKRERRKKRNKNKNKNKNKNRDINEQIAPSLLGKTDKMEILDIDEYDDDNNSIEFDDDDDDDLSDSLSDSSDSESEFLSSDDVKHISLLANGQSDDRMSFARILSDFKHVQKANVRSMAQQYENMAKAPQQRFSASHKKAEKSEVDIAKEVCSKRQRSATSGQVNNPLVQSAIYSPPRFADSLIPTSKQYKNKRQMSKLKSAQSQPCSPNITPYSPPNHGAVASPNPILTNSSKSMKGRFNKIAPPNSRKKGRGRAGRRGRGVQWDLIGASDTAPCTPSLIGDESIPSPITLSPATSFHSLQNNDHPHTIREEPDIENTMKYIDIDNDNDNDNDNDDDDEEKPNKSRDSFDDKLDKSDKMREKRTCSVPVSVTGKQPPPLTSLGSHSALYGNNSNGSDISVPSTNGGYASPGILSPGGGAPSLQIQNSHSLELNNHDAVAVVEEVNDDEPTATDEIDETNETIIIPNSWVFKPADEKDKVNGKGFKLKDKPDSPFDISSTQKDFQKVAEILMLECNNPKNLFKVLKGVCAKLKLSNPKYRRIDTMNSAVQNKLLKFEGADEFLTLLGFKQTMTNQNFWVCDKDQPPLSVLDSAINVCNDCLLKCNQKRATMDTLKKFSKHSLRSHKNKKRGRGKGGNRKKGKRSSYKHKVNKNGKNNGDGTPTKSMDTVNENAESPSPRVDEPDLNKQQSMISVDGTKDEEKDKDKEKEKEKAADIKITNLAVKQDSFDIEAPHGSTPSNSFDDDTLVRNPEFSDLQQSTSFSLQLPSVGMSLRTQSIRIDDATETLNELKFEEELEGGDEDRFQLSDIVWSITHKDNTDKDARSIILLCYPTFSDPYKLLKCLIERFFEPDESKINSQQDTSSRSGNRENSVSFSNSSAASDGQHSPKSSTIGSNYSTLSTIKFDRLRIESLWEVQVKVISFLQQWMRLFWREDWDSNEKMLDIVEQFCIKIENCYKNDNNLSDKDVKKGMKLIKMLHQTMDFQEASLRSQLKKNAFSIRQGSIPNISKFASMTDMSSAISKMRYNFIKLDNKHLAEQITLLDFKYFCAIQKRECLGQAWKKRNKYEIAMNICALIDQFNKMSKWVQATILLAKDVKQRGRLIKKFIKVSNHLLTSRNFQSLCAFHGALSSVPIHKLKHAWSHVPAKHIARFEEMRVIFNTRNNMGNLRTLHREAHAPLVPYTGIFLSDLVSIEEGNKKHKDDGTVNFAKLMRLSNAIDNILLYQRTRYEIQDDLAVQSLLLDDFKVNANLDNDWIFKFAADVAKKDGVKFKKKKSMLSLSKRW